jgi:hypothetical protein
MWYQEASQSSMTCDESTPLWPHGRCWLVKLHNCVDLVLSITVNQGLELSRWAAGLLSVTYKEDDNDERGTIST